MDISRVKKLFAGVSVAAISLTQVGTVFAAYSDVPAGVWYEDAVESFVESGYLDSSQTSFRGGDNANRAEFIKLVVELNGGILSTPPAVPSFDDVQPGAWYYGYIEDAAKEGWVKGDGNCYGTHPCYARPSANVNRAEAAALIVRAFNLDATDDAPNFVDVPEGQWYTSAVQTAADHCVLQGDESTGRARPADYMNRAEMVVMLHRVDQGLTYGVDCATGQQVEPMINDVTATSTTTVEVEFSVALDSDAMVDASHYMVSGAEDIDVTDVTMLDDSTVELTLAEETLSDEDYTVSVEDMMTEDGETFSDSMGFSGYSAIVRGEGTLEASLASTNPVGDTVPKGAVGVVMASLDMTATCDDEVIVTELTVLHEGFGDPSDVTGVYAAMDGGRVSRKRTLDSQDQTADIRLTTPLVIPACKTKTIDIVADFASTAGTASEHSLSVELKSDIESNALDVDGNFPLRGNTFKVAAVATGIATVSYRSVSPSEVDVGDTTKVLGKFEVSVSSVEDQTLYAATLEQAGSASDGDVTNIRIRRTDGTVVTNTVATTTKDYVTLTFDPPLPILEGDRLTLEVVGDVEGGATDTVKFQFEETSDLLAVGSLYGFGAGDQVYGSQVVLAGTATSVTIQAGEFTIEIDGPAQQQYTRDDRDAVLANVTMTTGGSDVDVRTMYVAIQGQTATGAGLVQNGGTTYDTIAEVLNDVELRNTRTGETISATLVSGASASTTTKTYQIYRFDDFTVEGQQDWQLRVDFIDNGAGNSPVDGDEFRAHICTEVGSVDTCDFAGLISAVTTYNLDVESRDTGDSLTDVRPGGTITGNFQEIAAPSLTLTMSSLGTSDNAVKGAKNVKLLRFLAKAGQGEDILLTSAAFQASSGSLLNGQNYALWVDKDGDGTVDTIIENGVSSQSSAVTFNELAGGGYVIPANQTVVFEVHADLAVNSTNNDLKLTFKTSSPFEAEEADSGSSLASGDITATTATALNLIIASSGNLFVSKDEDIRARQLLAGAQPTEEVLHLEFKAKGEDIRVDDIQITSSGSNASSVERLGLYKAGEATPFAYAERNCASGEDVPGDGSSKTTFCATLGSSTFVVAKDSSVDVVVRPFMKNSTASTSGQDIEFYIPHQISSSTGAIQATGIASSDRLDPADTDDVEDGEVFIGTTTAGYGQIVRSNTHEVVFAKLTSIIDTNPATGNAIPSGSDQEIARFKFTAATDSNQDSAVTLSGVIFTVNATNVDLDSDTFQMYKTDVPSTKVSCTTLNSASGSLQVQCLDTAALDTKIDSGQAKEYSLEVDVDDTHVTDTANSTLQVSLQNFTTKTSTFGSSNSHIHWADQEGTDTTMFYWVDQAEPTVRSTSYRG